MSRPATPYAFPSLLDGPSQSFVVIGTGLSLPNGPTADDLRDKWVDRATASLGLPSPNPAPNDNSFDLYAWADKSLTQLIISGKPEGRARFELARALGLLDAPEWFANTRLPLRGNTPRHRALARMVVEGRFSGFFCLNWDAWMDRALESVGLVEIRNPSDPLPTGRPWHVVAYARLVHERHKTKVGSNRIFRLYKPHGCVVELRDADAKVGDVVFKITQADLDLNTQTPERQAFLKGGIEELVGGHPVIGIGWRAAEAYLRDALVNATPSISEDAYILVARSWETKTPNAHDVIAQSRGTEKDKAHAKIYADSTVPSADSLFLWLFARLALRKLAHAAMPAAPSVLRQLLQEIEAELPLPGQQPHPLTSYCDDWLPAWIRLCWQTGAMRGSDPSSSAQIQPHLIPLGPPDLHIPLSGMNQIRNDLAAAAQLLAMLKSDRHYDYSRFPGALWQQNEQHLILPLPTWGDLANFNDLAGLKNLFTALRQHGLGSVRKISLLALAPLDTSPLDTAARNKLAALVAKRLPLAAYIRAGQLGWLNLQDLKGDLHA